VKVAVGSGVLVGRGVADGSGVKVAVAVGVGARKGIASQAPRLRVKISKVRERVIFFNLFSILSILSKKAE
jgi:hypothetical protein